MVVEQPQPPPNRDTRDGKPADMPPTPPSWTPESGESPEEYFKRTGFTLDKWFRQPSHETDREYEIRICGKELSDPPTKRLTGLTAERAIELRREHIIEETEKAIVEVCEELGEWIIATVFPDDLKYIAQHYCDRKFTVEFLEPEKPLISVRPFTDIEGHPRLKISWPVETPATEPETMTDSITGKQIDLPPETALDQDWKRKISQALEYAYDVDPTRWLSPSDLAVNLPRKESDIFRLLNRLVDEGYAVTQDIGGHYSTRRHVFQHAKHYTDAAGHALGLSHGDDPRQPDKRKGPPIC